MLNTLTKEKFLISAICRLIILISGRIIFTQSIDHSTIFLEEIYLKGPYNEKFNTTQDYDMYCRIINCYKIVNIKKPLANYRIHNQSM